MPLPLTLQNQGPLFRAERLLLEMVEFLLKRRGILPLRRGRHQGLQSLKLIHEQH